MAPAARRSTSTTTPRRGASRMTRAVSHPTAPTTRAVLRLGAPVRESGDDERQGREAVAEVACGAVTPEPQGARHERERESDGRLGRAVRLERYETLRAQRVVRDRGQAGVPRRERGEKAPSLRREVVQRRRGRDGGRRRVVEDSVD